MRAGLNAKTFELLSVYTPVQGATTPSATATTTTATATTSPYYSPLFLNRLKQLDFETTITPCALLDAVTSRRNQLLRFSVPHLQSRAHKMTWTSLSLVFFSNSAAWTATIPLDLVSPATGLGIGLLGTLMSIRWGVGLWARAQNKFWRDWDRVEQGLEQDLGQDLEQVITRVECVGLAGVEGFNDMIAHRRRRVERVDERMKQVLGLVEES